VSRPYDDQPHDRADDRADDLVLALVAECARKSRVCWLSWAARAPRLVWHVWHDDALVVLSGDEGQVLPGIVKAGTVQVTMRSKDTGGRLVAWTGTVDVVDPDDGSWDASAAALLGVRLNLADPAAAREGWRSTGTIVRIHPVVATEEPGPGPLP
jgi:hypothetical protein